MQILDLQVSKPWYRRPVVLAGLSIAVLVVIVVLVQAFRNRRLKRAVQDLSIANKRLRDQLPITDNENAEPAMDLDAEPINAPITGLRPERRAELGEKFNQVYAFTKLAEQMPVLRGGLDFNVQPLPSANNRAVWFRAFRPDGSRYVEVVRDPYSIYGDNRAATHPGDAWVLRLFMTGSGARLVERILPAAGDPTQDKKDVENAIRELLRSPMHETAVRAQETP